MPLLDYADLALEKGKLFNRTFSDIYFQPLSGFAESDHTFINANHLTDRFRSLAKHKSITIGEIGFGSGLNFINTVKHFLNVVNDSTNNDSKYAHSTPKLIYCSIEKYPIRLAQLQQIQQDWPLASIRESLYAQYPHNHPGFHHLSLHPQITLLLLMGEARQMLARFAGKIDAWFLDGFAPGRNPDCWSDSLLRDIARCSHQHTTLSSFSAARLLRDNLQNNGFDYVKRPGYGRKREMITASLRQSSQAKAHWTDLPPPPTGKQIAIIGAGIAGASTAYALGKHFSCITVFHAPNDHSGASAVPLAVPYLHPGVKDSLMRDYQLNAWHHALRHLQQLNLKNNNILHNCRIIRQPQSTQESQRHHTLFAQALLNENHWTLQQDTLHYLQAGVIQPNALISTLLSPTNICVKQLCIDSLTQVGQQWRIGEQLFDIVILATGWQTSLYPDHIIKKALRPIRGQGTLLKVAQKNKPADIYCDDHAFIPHPQQEIVYAGSSYYPNDETMDYRKQDDEDNKAAYLAKFSLNSSTDECSIAGSFVGIRGASYDYQPLLGPLPIEVNVIKQYKAWAKDSRLGIEKSLNYHPGLYVNAGYGSKGMTNAFLNAHILTAMITGVPLPIDQNFLPYILPARVIIKNIIRRRIDFS